MPLDPKKLGRYLGALAIPLALHNRKKAEEAARDLASEASDYDRRAGDLEDEIEDLEDRLDRARRQLDLARRTAEQKREAAKAAHRDLGGL